MLGPLVPRVRRLRHWCLRDGQPRVIERYEAECFARIGDIGISQGTADILAVRPADRDYYVGSRRVIPDCDLDTILTGSMSRTTVRERCFLTCILISLFVFMLD